MGTGRRTAPFSRTAGGRAVQHHAWRRRGDEFPALAPLLDDHARRDVLKLMGASLALAGLGGCDPVQPAEEALPYVDAPEFAVPGESRFYAIATLLSGYAQPVLVETREGRPTKVEGNPEHPASRGRTDLFAQAAVLGLYDPDRSPAVTHFGRITTWSDCEGALLARARALAATRGRGLALLTGAVTSPTFARLAERLRERLPALRWHVHEPLGNRQRNAATRLAFGEVLAVHHHLAEADVIVSLEADLLGPGPAQVPNAMAWIEGRRRAQGRGVLPALHVLESTLSLTGASATEALPLSTAEIHNVALALAQELGIGGIEAPDLPLALRSRASRIAGDLRRAGERALVATGAQLAPGLQALGFAINERLGALGRTLTLTAPVEAMPETEENDLAVLAGAIEAGDVDTLIMLDCNPAYTAPADLGFADLLQKVPFRLHAGAYHDETAALCEWHMPLAHPFETWSDARAVDGTAGVMQPLIRPIRGGRSAFDLLSLLAGATAVSPEDQVRATWRGRLPPDDVEAAWRRLLRDGFADDTAAPARTSPLKRIEPPAPMPASKLEAVFRADPSIWDGRFANNAWLQELPKPLTKLTWDNAVLISSALAAELRLENGDLVDLSHGARRVRGPVWITPGQAARTITLHLGYGRTRSGRVGDRIGHDAFTLRTTSEPWRIGEIVLQAAGGRASLASTQPDGSLFGHEDIVRSQTPAELQAGHKVEHRDQPLPSLYPDWPSPDYAWAMAIDLDACVGCNACVVACQAENNVPVVGRAQVAMGREMHWLRIDRYTTGEADAPKVHFQPLPCMHCENAPCEVGCPVNATVHGPEGLNQMVYNRCVGTRTCASYCPYKVRRFNFLDYAGAEPDGREPQRNPDVTVRARGVMEKCTYCVQRISRARIQAKKEDRRIRDGEVVTACQQVCPTGAIVFGDRKDASSLVAKAEASGRNYSLLGELNTRPRTTYLAEVRAAPDEEA